MSRVMRMARRAGSADCRLPTADCLIIRSRDACVKDIADQVLGEQLVVPGVRIAEQGLVDVLVVLAHDDGRAPQGHGAVLGANEGADPVAVTAVDLFHAYEEAAGA